jgi:hypothetical protein
MLCITQKTICHGNVYFSDAHDVIFKLLKTSETNSRKYLIFMSLGLNF